MVLLGKQARIGIGVTSPVSIVLDVRITDGVAVLLEDTPTLSAREVAAAASVYHRLPGKLTFAEGPHVLDCTIALFFVAVVLASVEFADAWHHGAISLALVVVVDARLLPLGPVGAAWAKHVGSADAWDVLEAHVSEVKGQNSGAQSGKNKCGLHGE